MAHGHPRPEALTSPETLAEQVLAIAGPGDLVICLGAGSSTSWQRNCRNNLKHGSARGRRHELDA